MKSRSQQLMLVAALILIATYFLPIWQISLEAPQYPEGLGLRIWIDTIDGQNPHDLRNINNLNHYIGMKEIVPDAIPELRIMPWLIGFLIVTGLVPAWRGGRGLIYTWTLLFILIGIVGMVDFYMWEYDYGHNLDPNASIKVPGMSYQPPLIGSKQLLNFVAVSMPAIGGWILGVSILLGIAASWMARKEHKQTHTRKVNSRAAMETQHSRRGRHAVQHRAV